MPTALLDPEVSIVDTSRGYADGLDVACGPGNFTRSGWAIRQRVTGLHQFIGATR
jgi:hypothetical protein